MALNDLAPDFKEFLRLLNAHEVRYLIIGGYAVALYGYPRATGDLDVWVSRDRENADRISETLAEFGFQATNLSAELFMERDRIVRMGVPPVRIEIFTEISGVDFDGCYLKRRSFRFGDVPAPVISLADLRANKKASGRFKDLEDLEQLPSSESEPSSDL